MLIFFAAEHTVKAVANTLSNLDSTQNEEYSEHAQGGRFSAIMLALFDPADILPAMGFYIPGAGIGFTAYRIRGYRCDHQRSDVKPRIIEIQRDLVTGFERQLCIQLILPISLERGASSEDECQQLGGRICGRIGCAAAVH